MPKTWLEWHDLYNTDARLQQRLAIVQEYIATSLTHSPRGIIQLVSACAGDGRDILGVLPKHPRASDVRARLVELNPQLVERGRDYLETTPFKSQIEFVNGDATSSNAYLGAVPADVILVCGIFGNLADEAALRQLIGNLKFLAKPGAFVAWTRGHFQGIAYSEIVRQQLREASFEEVDFRLTATGDMGVGLHRFQGETAPLPENHTLFVFSGTPEKAR
jgi:hypothetical protein